MSNLLDGTFTIAFLSSDVYVNPNFLNTFKISSFGITVPKTSFTFLKVISISLSFTSVLSYTTVPVTTFPSAYFSNNLHALSAAIYVLLGSKPFSNLLLASLLKIFLDVSLIFTESKIAASIITFCVSFSTSVSSPPITPARPTPCVLSAITISSLLKVLSILSSVVSFSPSSAILTTSLFPNLSAS